MTSTHGDGVDEIDFFESDNLVDDVEYVYDMNHRKRGKFIIINNKTFQSQTKMPERSGTDKDAAALYSIFLKFGFDVTLLKDQTTEQMTIIMRDAGRENHSDYDCFGVAVLSHGDEGVIFGVDGIISIDRFVNPIKQCKSLVGKPKIFFFQACRGTDLDCGIESDAVGETGRPKLMIPLEADCLYAYSTVPGYFSWRNSAKGSWFVQALTQILQRPESGKMDLVRILTRVNHAVAYQFESNASKPEMNRKKQIPSIVSMLTKDLFLTPK
jgi:caspase 7